MRDLISLYLVFFKLGLVNFGGGYAMLPLLDRELVLKRGWTTEEELRDYYAVGQCTPGAIAVNVSTFIGIKRKGVLGGICATLGFISPAFIIIFIIASLLTNFKDNEYVANALAGIRVCVFFLVLFAIKKLFKKSIKDKFGLFLAVFVAFGAIFIKSIPLYIYVIMAALLGLMLNSMRDRKNLTLVKEDKIKPKIDKNNLKKSIFFSILGFIVGVVLGFVGIISIIVVKNKYYLKGILSSLVLWCIALCGILVLIFTNNPIIFKLYFEFFRVGICAFGGGLATIPFLSELGTTTGWFSSIDLANMIAVSESTPGAMGINMSTYVGYTVLQNTFGNVALSFMGSIISTLGLVTPSIIVIAIVQVFLKKFKDNKYVEWVFYGLRAASIGLIIAALYSILKVSLFNQYVVVDNGISNTIDAVSYSFNQAFKDFTWNNLFSSITNFFNLLINWKALAIGAIFGIAIFKLNKHPIVYIVFAAVIGILLQMSSMTII